MTIPASLLPDGIPKTLENAYNALIKRLSPGSDLRIASDWSFHLGTPDETNLPNEKAGVWLDFSTLTEDPDNSTFNSDYFIGTWVIHIVVQDQGNDPHGFDPMYGLRLMGSVLKVLTETMSDVSLDDAVDFTDRVGVSKVIGKTSGGDRRVEDWTIMFQASHPLTNFRTS